MTRGDGRDLADFVTAELSTTTWPHFERLFTEGNGWDFCDCFHGQEPLDTRGRAVRPAAERRLTRAQIAPVNRAAKHELVACGQAHGVLVMAGDGEPAGWCRYGPRSDFPWLMRRHDGIPDLWSINCFVVLKSRRRQGVATLALRAALASIRAQGGGTVEAYPIHTAGRHLDRSMPDTYVHGVGPIRAAWGSVAGQGWTGTVAPFEQEGFKAVQAMRDRVLMRKVVRPAPNPRPSC